MFNNFQDNNSSDFPTALNWQTVDLIINISTNQFSFVLFIFEIPHRSLYAQTTIGFSSFFCFFFLLFSFHTVASAAVADRNRWLNLGKRMHGMPQRQ